jgi:hypothetical protein
LGLEPTSQPAPELGPIEAGEKAVPYRGLSSYLRGAKFAGLAIRSRHRDLDEDFSADMKGYIEMLDRYLEALRGVEDRKA